MYANHSVCWSKCVLPVTLMIFPLTFAEAAPPPDVFYVSPFGVNAALRSGSASYPWRTIGYALGRAEVGSGDIIVVQSDGVDGNDDYTENVSVGKSVKIRGDDAALSPPVVRASSASDDVFEVAADGVEISGLSIYGATASTSVAAIHLNGVHGCLVRNNACGLDAAKTNALGVYVSDGARNTVDECVVLYASACGVRLLRTPGGIVYGNEIRHGAAGVEVNQSPASVVVHNVVTDNSTLLGNGWGVFLCAGSGWSVVTGNAIERNDKGVRLDASDVIVAANAFTENVVGLWAESTSGVNDVFYNSFDGNTLNVAASASIAYPVVSLEPLFYRYADNFSKSRFGNRYSDYSGADADGDGLGDLPYTAYGCRDEAPLVASASQYALLGWTMGPADEGAMTLDDNDWSRRGEVVVLPVGGSLVFVSEHGMDELATFAAGSQASGTTWSGWFTFASPPAVGEGVTATLGSASSAAGAFLAVGPSAAVAGDGASYALRFAADAGQLILREGEHLAVRLTNTGSSALYLLTGGGASALFAPEGARWGGPLIPWLLLLE